ncbi:MAG: hypothetical protein D6730_14320 [Bacteroidetes bacterium]|nr:MAG: hypothetical protein D6730_14320 [Bacteroidota bacterium]
MVSCAREETSGQPPTVTDSTPVRQLAGKREMPQRPYQWVRRDTLLFEYLGSVELISYNEQTGTYLSRDWPQKKINEFDKTGKLLHSWDFTGAGPTQVGPELYSMAYTPQGDIVVQGQKGYYFYDGQGNFIRKIDFSDKVLPSAISLVGNIFFYERQQQARIASQIISNTSEYDATMKGFYEHATFLLEMNLQGDDYLYAIPYPANSLYRNESHYPLGSRDARISLDKKGQAYAIFPFDPKLYVYDVYDGYALKGYIDTRPEHFDQPPVWLPYNQLPESQQSNKSYFTASSYFKVYSFQDSLIGLVYSQGLPEHYVTAQFKMSDYNDSLYVYNQYYFQLFSGPDKLCPDLALPEGTSIVAYIHSLDEILLTARLSQLEEEPEGALFYLYSLQPVEEEMAKGR